MRHVRPFLIPAAPADPEVPAYAPYWPLVNARLATVELIRINKAQAPMKAVQRAVRTLGKYVAGEVRLIEGDDVQLDADADGRVTRQQAESVCQGARHRQACDVTLIIAPGLSDFAMSYCKRNTESIGRVIVVINCNVMNSKQRRPWYWTLRYFVSMTQRWQWLLTHELLHALNLPYDQAHASTGHHCTRPECVLYSPIDWRFAIAGVLRLHMPMDLCRWCIADLRQARDKAGGRYFEADDPYDPMTYFDEMVQLNPESATELMYRAEARRARKDINGAIADFTEALRIGAGKRTAACYNNRAVQYAHIGHWPEAIADCEKALSIEPGKNLTLQILATIRATCPDRQFHNPTQALELARRAMEVTRGEDLNVRMLLGTVYMYAGQYEQAMETWESCLRIPVIEASAAAALAYLLACCPDERIRDGAKAIDLARRACELTGSTQPRCLGPMAAACAETGDFDQAVTYQKMLLSLLKNGDGSAASRFYETRAQETLTHYLAGRPSRFEAATDAHG